MKVSDFRDRHNGEIIFILGGGPSLHNVDINLIKNYTCISINSSIAKCHKLEKLYFVSDDSDIKSWNYYKILKNNPCVKFLYKNKFINSNLEKVVLFSHKSWFSPEDNSYNMDGLRMTKDEIIIGARISTGSATHIAYYLGAKVIVLLGNDCQLSRDNFKYRYFWQYPGEKNQYRIKGRKFNRQTQQIGFDEQAYKKYWECFAKVNDDIIGKEVEIIDASDSSLECFPKMTVKEVLDRYGAR